MNFNALDREKKKRKEKKRKEKKWLDPRFDVDRFKTLHDECTKRRAQVFELAPYEQRESRFRACTNVPLHGERAFRKRLYIIFSRPERNTEKKIRSDSERVSKTAKSFTQD